MAQTNYKASSAAGVNLYAIDTTPTQPCGAIVKGISPDYGEGQFIYLKGVASNTEGSVSTYDEAGVTTLLVTNAIGPVAVSLTANTTTTSWSWYQILGKACVASTAAADNALLGVEGATAGVLGDAEAVGDQINGLISRSATDTPATGYQWVQIFAYPYVNDFTPTAA